MNITKVTKAANILKEMINNLERVDNSSKENFYQSALTVLQKKDLTASDLFILKRNFCGYVVRVELTDNEYQNLNQLISLLDD